MLGNWIKETNNDICKLKYMETITSYETTWYLGFSYKHYIQPALHMLYGKYQIN